MTSSSLLDEIKIELRSLLISSKIGLTDNQLCHDYALFNNQRLIPYEIFGYSTINEFFNSLNDILYRTSDGYIHPIIDQSTEHIYKFVQQQRNKKKKKQISKDYRVRTNHFFKSILSEKKDFIIVFFFFIANKHFQ